jgi:hypothetical protein
MLLSMLSSFVFRAVRDAIPENPAAQERILGASLFAMAVADVRHLQLISLILGLVLTSESRSHSKFWCTIDYFLLSDAHSIIATFVGLPNELRYSPHLWNSMTHGNITTVVVLLAGRFVCSSCYSSL